MENFPQETLEYKMNKQMESFLFNPINLFEENKRLLTVTSFGTKNSVFNITDDNNSFLLVYQVFGDFLLN